MKIVMIPDTHTMWEATINKKHYAYPGGTEQNVPDEVAALIADINRVFPEPTPETVKPPFDLAGGVPAPTPGGNVPDPEVADIGKVLGIVEDGTGAKYAPVEGSGLPDPSSLTDGTAMVAVNGEWKMQEGYGYTGEPAFEPITWDGDTSGKPYVDRFGEPTFYKVSDDIITAAQFVGATMEADTAAGEQTVVIPEERIEAISGLVSAYSYILSGVAGTYGEGETALNVPEDGTYFFKVDGMAVVTSLTAPSSVHQFDSALIPGVIPADPSEDGTYVLTCTITDGEAVYSWETNA